MAGVAVAQPVPPDDAPAIADAVQRLQADWPASRDRAANGVARTATAFAPARFQQELTAVLSELVAHRRNRRPSAPSPAHHVPHLTNPRPATPPVGSEAQ